MAVDTVDNARKWTIISQQVANPAAGADWSLTVPAGSEWRVKAVTCKLATNSTAATRVPALSIKDASGNVVLLAPPGTTEGASNALTFGWGVSCLSATQGSVVMGAAPEITLPEGFVIGTNTAAIQTGDQWSLINLLIEQAQAL